MSEMYGCFYTVGTYIGTANSIEFGKQRRVVYLHRAWLFPRGKWHRPRFSRQTTLFQYHMAVSAAGFGNGHSAGICVQIPITESFPCRNVGIPVNQSISWPQRRRSLQIVIMTTGSEEVIKREERFRIDKKHPPVRLVT